MVAVPAVVAAGKAKAPMAAVMTGMMSAGELSEDKADALAAAVAASDRAVAAVAGNDAVAGVGRPSKTVGGSSLGKPPKAHATRAASPALAQPHVAAPSRAASPQMPRILKQLY